MKKKIVIIVLCLLLFFSFLGIFHYLDFYTHYELEEKEVWITSDIICGKDVDNVTTNCFYRYDDHNGEKGILYTNKKKNYNIDEVVTVYRNKASGYSTDSTHNWSLGQPTKSSYLFLSALFVVITVVEGIILIRCLKKYGYIKLKKS